LREAAAAAGRSPDEYASVLVAQALGDDWAEAKAALAHYDRTGEFVDAGEAFAELRVRLVERLANKR
jgi:hypothetical protein